MGAPHLYSQYIDRHFGTCRPPFRHLNRSRFSDKEAATTPRYPKTICTEAALVKSSTSNNWSQLLPQKACSCQMSARHAPASRSARVLVSPHSC